MDSSFSTKHLSFTQHWGLVIDYLDTDPREGLPKKFIYHANDVEGKLIATFEEFTPKFSEGEGVVLKDLPNAVVSKKAVEDFCNQFNSKKDSDRDYVLPDNNCQTFVLELLTHLQLSNTFADLNNANFVKKMILKSSQSSSAFLAKDWISYMVNPDIAKGWFQLAFQFMSKKAKDLQTTVEVVLPPMPEKIWFTKTKGVFALWAVVRITVELFSEHLIKSNMFQEYSEEERKALAYGLSKATGLALEVVAGLVAGNGIGLVIAWWLASSFLAYMIFKVPSNNFSIYSRCRLA